MTIDPETPRPEPAPAEPSADRFLDPGEWLDEAIAAAHPEPPDDSDLDDIGPTSHQTSH